MKTIKTFFIVLLLQPLFSLNSYAVSCIDAPNSLAFERCSEARSSSYSGSNSGFMSELGSAWNEGARRSSRELAEMKSRGELNWFQNTIMFILYILFVGFITAIPKTSIVRVILGLVFFIPFAVRFWEYDYIMVILVFLTSFGMIGSYIEQDEERKTKTIENDKQSRNKEKEENKVRDFNFFKAVLKRRYQSHLNSMLKTDLINYARNIGVSSSEQDTKKQIIEKLILFNLNKMLKAELIDYAKKQGAIVKSRYTKAQIIEKIINIK